MRKDILFGDTQGEFDLTVKNGDFIIGPSDIQHVRDIFISAPGQYKQWPKLGINIKKDINSTMDASLTRKIQIHCASDGYSPANIRFVDGAVLIRL